MLIVLLLNAVFQIDAIVLPTGRSVHSPCVAKTCGDHIDADQRPPSQSVLCFIHMALAAFFWLAVGDKQSKRPRLTPKSSDPTPSIGATSVGIGAKVDDRGFPLDGVVNAVRGAVVDVVFAGSAMPPIKSALVVEWDAPSALHLEVDIHLNQKTIRAVAFQSTAGLARGVSVHTNGDPLTVPVGRARNA